MAFLVFEGGDGVGKSTICRLLEKKLKALNISCVLTREPGGSLIGEKIRKILLKNKVCSRSELLFYQALRAQHVFEKLKPHLNKKKWLLCERFTASTIAYQSVARGEKLKDVLFLNDYASFGLKPDLNILLDLNLKDKKTRMDKRKKKLDYFELEKKDFHQKVRQSYLNQAKKHPRSWMVISALKDKEEIVEILLKEFKRRRWL